MISVLVANINEFYRAGVGAIISATTGMKIVGEVKDSTGAVRWCRDHHADIVLLDIGFPSMSGLDAARKISRYASETKVIILTDEHALISPYKVMSSGAAGYLYQSSDRMDLLHAIRIISRGQRYVDSDIAQQTILDTRLHAHDSNPLDKLSHQERQVMVMISQGIKVTQIADKMCLSSKTVNSYRYRIFNKLNIDGDIKLTHLALRYGLIHIDSVVPPVSADSGGHNEHIPAVSRE
ncbi:MAG: response regulator [Morganella sp. (in: enterobacteria)]